MCPCRVFWMRKKCGCGVRVWHIGSDYHLQQVVSRDTSVHCKLPTSGSPRRAMIHMIMFVITIKVLMVMAAIMFLLMAVFLVIMIVDVSKCFWSKLRIFCTQKTIMDENDVSDHDDNDDHQCGLKMPAMNKLSPMRRLCDPGQGRVHNQCAGFWSGWGANLWW